jgi:WD40 repeat protein
VTHKDPDLRTAYPEIYNILKETHRLLLEFSEPLNADPSQLYKSALPFLRQDSILRKMYASRSDPQFSFAWGERPNRDVWMSSLPVPYWAPRRLALSSDSKLVATTSKLNQGGYWFAAWEIQSTKSLGEFKYETEEWLCAMALERHYLITSWEDGQTRCWDLETLSLHYTSPGYLVTLMPESLPRVFDPQSGAVKDCTTGLAVTRTTNEPVALPGKLVDWFGTQWNYPELWLDEEKRRALSFPDELITISQGDDADKVACTAWSPKTGLLACGMTRSEVVIVDALTGQKLLTYKDLEGKGEGWVTAITISEDQEAMYVAGGGNLIGIWETRTGKLLCIMRGHGERIDCVSFTTDNSLLITGSQDGTIKIWDWRAGTPIMNTQGHTLWVTSVSFGFDGARIASSSWNNEVHIWDAKTGKELVRKKVRLGIEVVIITWMSNSTAMRYYCNRRDVGETGNNQEYVPFDLNVRMAGSKISLLTVEEEPAEAEPSDDDEESTSGDAAVSAVADVKVDDTQKLEATQDIDAQANGKESATAQNTLNATESPQALNSAAASEPTQDTDPSLTPKATSEATPPVQGKDEAANNEVETKSPDVEGDGSARKDEDEATEDDDGSEDDDSSSDGDDESSDGEGSSDSAYGYHFQDGWILSPTRERIFWIPERYRGTSTYTHEFWGNTLAIGGTDGMLSLLELPPLPAQATKEPEGVAINGVASDPVAPPPPTEGETAPATVVGDVKS